MTGGRIGKDFVAKVQSVRAEANAETATAATDEFGFGWTENDANRCTTT